MKKFLLLISCLVFALSAKAAEYEISTALSSPYGMYSTFTVFGSAEIYDMIMGAPSAAPHNEGYSAPNYTSTAITSLGGKFYRPAQVTSLEASGISFSGDMDIYEDLRVNADNQSYGHMQLTLFSSTASSVGYFPTYIHMDFDNVNINNLKASQLVAGRLELGTLGASILYTESIGGGSFTLGNLRPEHADMSDSDNRGSRLLVSTPRLDKCGQNKGHYFGPWKFCAVGNVCSRSDTCNALLVNGNCPNDLDQIKRCTDIRKAKYKVPKIGTGLNEPLDFKPSVEIRVVYDPCEFKPNENRCDWKYPGDMDNAEHREQAGLSEELENIPRCPQGIKDSCVALCDNPSLAPDGCINFDATCVEVSSRNIPNPIGCGASGWEIGSGLECRDNFRKLTYKIYTCPANAAYAERPLFDNGSEKEFTQYRDVVCAPATHEMEPHQTGNANCSKNLVTLEYNDYTD